MHPHIKLTPMMEQWQRAKNQHQDAILLFRMGDFYELFGEDAKVAAPILDLALTSRDKDRSALKMAGFPAHSADGYVAKLLEHGHKVAICEQLEDPKQSRGVVKRGITNVLTPGTVIEGEDSQDNSLNFLVGFIAHDNDFAICAIDLRTAAFNVSSSSDRDKVLDEGLRLTPKELVVFADDHQALALSQELIKRMPPSKVPRMEKRTKLSSGKGFGFESLNDAENRAAELILCYIRDLRGGVPTYVSSPRRYSIEQQLLMDEATRKNLDLFPQKRSDPNNLFSVVNKTKTAMGHRALWQNLSAPLTSLSAIDERHAMVSELLVDGGLRGQLRDTLSRLCDVEKLTALASSQKLTPKGMARLRDSLGILSQIKELLNRDNLDLVKKLGRSMPELSELYSFFLSALEEDPPHNIKDGSVIRAGFDGDLDEYRDVLKNSKRILLQLEQNEREKTGIPSLKIRFTRVFGYYIEVTKTHLSKVPKYFVRKQTVANAERFVTEDLSQLEAKMNSAEIKIRELEEKRYDELLNKVVSYSKELMSLSKSLALVDVIAGFSELAAVHNFTCPVMVPSEERLLEISEGRHAIVEDICLRNGSFFVPNDLVLDSECCSIMLVTGPNMAGKSTIMRQTALIQVLAQMGSFVPARSAKLSIVDAIFARVGASDDLATGRSTFMVEMSETAAILSHATDRSLILLDEIGRGTSTYDGLSIAQAVTEYIHEKIKARTIFATHYHELTHLASSLMRLKNFHVEVDEGSEEVRFLYTLKEGPCHKSFGIQVARMSGLPDAVLDRAMEVLNRLESKDNAKEPQPKESSLRAFSLFPQLVLFNEHDASKQFATEQAKILDKILGLDIDRLSPIQALNKLSGLQQALRSAQRRGALSGKHRA